MSAISSLWEDEEDENDEETDDHSCHYCENFTEETIVPVVIHPKTNTIHCVSCGGRLGTANDSIL